MPDGTSRRGWSGLPSERLRCPLLLLAAWFWPLLVEAQETTRVWRDESGKHEIHARFLGMEGTTVLLAADAPSSPNPEANASETGRTSYEPSRLVRVPCERLAMADQQYIATVTCPEPIEAQVVTLELRDSEQRLMLPLGRIPSTWDYEVVLLRVGVAKESVDLRSLLASEANVAETARQVRTATLRNPGHFPLTVEVEGKKAIVRVTVRLSQFKEATVLRFFPSINWGNKPTPFATLPLETEAASLRRAILLDQHKLAAAQHGMKTLPLEIQRTRQMVVPASVPGAQLHNSHVLHHASQLEIVLQRAQRRFQSVSKSLPLDAARQERVVSIHKVVERYAGKVEAEFLVQRRCGQLVQPVLAAGPGGRVTLGTALPVLE